MADGRPALRPSVLPRRAVACWRPALAAGVFLRSVWPRRFLFPFSRTRSTSSRRRSRSRGRRATLRTRSARSPTARGPARDDRRPLPEAPAGFARAFGATVTGVRMPSFCGGVLSLLTATLLARALLPRGGAALAALVLAGLRWHLILSRWGWHSILTPLVDVAALLLLRARRGRRPAPASWPASCWASGRTSTWRPGPRASGCAALPLARRPRRRRYPPARGARSFSRPASSSRRRPLFLFREGRTISYFGRAAGTASCARWLTRGRDAALRGGRRRPARALVPARPGRLVRPAEPLAAGLDRRDSRCRCPGAGAGLAARRVVGVPAAPGRAPRWRRSWRAASRAIPTVFDSAT